MHTEDKYKTTFRTHHGHFEWLVMPFGLSTTSTTFQALINGILKFEMLIFVLIFFYDILIYSVDWECNIKHLEIVLITLTENKLYAKFSKCNYGMT